MKKENFLYYYKKYNYAFIFLLFFILIDHIGILAIEGKLVIDKPLIIYTFGIFLFLLLVITGKTLGRIISIIILSIQSILVILFKMLFDMQGKTVFSITQLKFLGEGKDIVTKYIIDYPLAISFLMLLVAYILLVYYKSKKDDSRISIRKILNKVFLIIFTLILISSFISRIVKDTFFDYNNKIYSLPRKYKTFGITGNLVNELFKFNNEPNKLDEKEVFDFLFSKTKKSKNISPNNNLIIILVETFEWYSFLSDLDQYPKGLDLKDEELDLLFPNIRKFYNESLKITNYYSKETTLYSENLALLGHHPAKTVPAYDHTFANYEFSLPNVFKKRYSNSITNYFHNNNISFYSRGSIMNKYGFDNVYGSERLYEEFSEHLNYQQEILTEKIISSITDKDMFEVAKEKMFPLNKQFFTFITTLTMHGSFENYRNSLKEYYDKLDEINPNIFSNNLDSLMFKNYIVSVMNFDDALGIMMDYLKANNLLNKTTILLVSDHNAYSNDLTFKIRNETFYKPISFNVPFMIYDKNLKIKTIDKFTTNIDIVPTVFDLLGINYYENFYYGNSVFHNKESISYSYYYDSFLTDKILFNNLSNTIYIDKDINDDYISNLENTSKTMFEKVKYIDQWYFYYSNEYLANNKIK